MARRDLAKLMPMNRALPAAFLLALLQSPAWSKDPPAADPAALVAQGWDEFRLNETRRAETLFAKAAAAAPKNSEVQLMALYGWGASLAFRSPDPEEAKGIEKYNEVIALSPQGDMAAWSLLALARLEHAVPVDHEPNYEKVRAAYDRLIAAFPDHPASEEAFLYKQATYAASLKAEGAQKALDAIQDFIKAKPGSKWLGPAWGLAAECYAILGDPEKRLAAEIQALEHKELDVNDPRADNSGAYWKIASLAEFQAGDFDTARKYYRKLFEEYPTDQKAFVAQMALDRLARTEMALKKGQKP